MSTPLPMDPSAAATGADQHQALYRRWRAQRFSELLGQDPIVATLQRAVAADRIAHAYLFVGPRGTGKTSAARILAKAINCTNRGVDGEPCDTCPACVSIREGRAMDVIEIDAASHGLVEDARDLVMRAVTSPSQLRRRVYIIDEVHMLSTHAFNALLKMVEEPPGHVVFVLATTDTHKVPATIISRTQRFDFRRLQADVIIGKLTRIVEAEGASAEPEALALIARLAEGGMRDAESLLDRVLAFAGDRVTAQAVRESVGLADELSVSSLLDAYLAGDATAALDAIDALADAGRDLGQVAAQAEIEARERLLAASADPGAARRLATILRTLGDAAGAGAREGRARLGMELLAVDLMADPAHPAATVPPKAAAAVTRAKHPEVVVAARSPSVEPRDARAAAEHPAAEHPAAEHPAADEPTAEQPTVDQATVEQAAAEQPTVGGAIAAPPERFVSRPPAELERSRGAGPPELVAVQGRWGEVVDRATPAIKPLLRECRPVALDGVRLTLAFPEERRFMREKASTRAAAIEQLLSDVLTGSWAIDCITSNVELEPLTVAQAVAPDPDDPEAQALLDGVLRITGGELVDAPEVR